MLNYICSGKGNINVLLNGQMFCINSSHLHYKQIVEALEKKDEKALNVLLDVVKRINNYTSGVDVKVIDGEVLYRGKPVYGYLVDKILLQMEQEFGFQPMCSFLENLMDNPDPGSIDQLYPFLEQCGLTLTDDGCFLGWKYVDKDSDGNFWACHANKDGSHNRNNPGDIVKMPREEVTYNPSVSCAAGLHVGSKDYVGGQSHIVLVKVNPKHAVSVPNYEAGKLRCCQYEVIQVYSGEELPAPVYSHNVDKKGLGPSKFAPPAQQAGGRFDNPTASHWSN